MNRLSQTSIFPTFRYSAWSEIKAAAIAQASGAIFFAAAAVVYGLITIPTPTPMVKAPVSSPIDYQLKPDPASSAPAENSDSPGVISREDQAARAQVIATLKNEAMTWQMASLNLPGVASGVTSSPHVQYVEFGGTQTGAANAKLPFSKIVELSSRDLLGWTLELPPSSIIAFNVPSPSDASELLQKFMHENKGSKPQPIKIVIMTPPEGSSWSSWTPVSFTLVKAGPRLLFTNASFKVLEVFDATAEK